MVDAVISFGVQRLGDLLIQEAVLLPDVREQVEQLRNELRMMQCFMKDADAKQQQGDEGIRNWVAEIRDVAYDAEDVIDTFILRVASKRKRGVQDFLKRNICIINKGIHLRKVGMEIQAILSRLETISNNRIRYDIRDVGDSSANQRQQRQQQLRRSYPHVEDDDIIGLKDPTKKLVDELMKEEERSRVISIVGTGGLGKTTLAKEVYRHADVQSRFDCRAWTFISQQCNRKDVLQELLKKASSPSNDEMKMIRNMTEEDLVEKLHNYLREKRYLMVLDDIWRPEAWDIISPALPNGKTGSKILLTTRNKEVARHADRWSLHLEPRLLTPEESWELLYRKVFPKNMVVACCSPGLEKLGREMVSRCGGLPLGVAILGGLLVTKELEVKEWEVVLKDVNAYMNKGENGGVEGILSLSYDDLPYHLKPCFLYLGLFPEDSEIIKRKLIHLWIAEGFVPEQKGGKVGLTMEDVAEHQYLDELVQRSLVQIDKRGLTGGVKTFRMHDLMRDLCLSKASDANFLDISEKSQQHGQAANYSTVALTPTNYRIRRHANHGKGDEIRFDYLENSSNYSHLRTFLVFSRKITNYQYPKIKLFRVLDLESVRITNGNITQEVGKLIHLRYLALRSRGEMSISPSIGNLRNLQTLRLFGFSGLPETTSRMSKLRLLDLGWGGQINDKWRVDNLINLQTLRVARAGRWLIKGCFEKLTNLRKLRIRQLLRSQIEEIILPAVVAKSSSSMASNDHKPLTSLILECDNQEKFPNLELFSLCDKLLKLNLLGQCKSENLHYPQNLTKLSLSKTYLNQDPMAALQHLPNLKHLYMFKSYDGEEMICSAQGFHQLQYLTLCNESKLKKWGIEKRGMPLLKSLKIYRCEELSMLPEGLRFITTLQQLTISGMPPEFEARVERGGSGEDWYKIQHIPSIII